MYLLSCTHLLFIGPLAQAVHQPHTGARTDIGLQQPLFQVIPHVIRDWRLLSWDRNWRCWDWSLLYWDWSWPRWCDARGGAGIRAITCVNACFAITRVHIWLAVDNIYVRLSKPGKELASAAQAFFEGVETLFRYRSLFHWFLRNLRLRRRFGLFFWFLPKESIEHVYPTPFPCMLIKGTHAHFNYYQSDTVMEISSDDIIKHHSKQAPGIGRGKLDSHRSLSLCGSGEDVINGRK